MTMSKLRWVVLGLAAAAVAEQLRRPPSQRTWQGAVGGLVPYDFRPPTLDRIKATYWAPHTDQLFRPHAFGVGWGLNVGRIVQVYREQVARAASR